MIVTQIVKPNQMVIIAAVNAIAIGSKKKKTKKFVKIIEFISENRIYKIQWRPAKLRLLYNQTKFLSKNERIEFVQKLTNKNRIIIFLSSECGGLPEWNDKWRMVMALDWWRSVAVPAWNRVSQTCLKSSKKRCDSHSESDSSDWVQRVHL